jgi:hypothetical protein
VKLQASEAANGQATSARKPTSQGPTKAMPGRTLAMLDFRLSIG